MELPKEMLNVIAEMTDEQREGFAIGLLTGIGQSIGFTDDSAVLGQTLLSICFGNQLPDDQFCVDITARIFKEITERGQKFVAQILN